MTRQPVPASLAPVLLATMLAACSPQADGDSPPDRSAEQPSPPAAQPGPAEATADDAAAEAAVDRAALQPTIPARFHGTYAESPAQCGDLSHGRFTVRADAIKFFESTGEVENVRVDGPSAAATVTEQYGDSPPSTYVFYMRLLDDGSLRYRYDMDERLTWVRCP